MNWGEMSLLTSVDICEIPTTLVSLVAITNNPGILLSLSELSFVVKLCSLHFFDPASMCYTMHLAVLGEGERKREGKDGASTLSVLMPAAQASHTAQLVIRTGRHTPPRGGTMSHLGRSV